MNWLANIRDRYRVKTDPLMTERRLELAVICLLLLLALQVLLNSLWLAVPPQPEPVAPAPESLRVGEVGTRSLVDGNQSAEIRSRPLFFASRRPETAEIEDKDAAAQQAAAEKKKDTRAPELKLVGVFGGPDTQGIIALEKGKRLRLLVGEEVSGWTLKKVDSEQAVLVSGADSASISLKRTDISAIVESQPDEPSDDDSDSEVETGADEAPRETEQSAKPPPGELVLGGRK